MAPSDVIKCHTQDTSFLGSGLTPLQGIQSAYSMPHQQDDGQ